jgi:CDP-diacylglycerol--glycerol-3-phosphate 3-phosphatidyltransferase
MNLLTLPNLLSLYRLIISPLAGFEIYKGNCKAASFLFLTAAVSDFFDGYFARKLNSETYLGVLLDPVADKVFVISFLFPLLFGNFQYKPAAVVVFPFLLKELVIILETPFAVKRNVDPKPNVFGKISTTLLFLYGGTLLIENCLNEEFLLLHKTLEISATAFLLLTAYTYYRKVFKGKSPGRGV